MLWGNGDAVQQANGHVRDLPMLHRVRQMELAGYCLALDVFEGLDPRALIGMGYIIALALFGVSLWWYVGRCARQMDVRDDHQKRKTG